VELLIIPIEISISEFITRVFVSSVFFSCKLFAKNRDTPTGTPTAAIVEKIIDIEITVEDVPIISGVAILVSVIHNKYPENNWTRDSTNIKAAPFPMMWLINLVHPQSLT
jgi:hypothetical protein